MKDVDDFGASDAWLMYGFWMWTAGHPLIAAFSFTLCAIICFIPDRDDSQAAAEGKAAP